MEVIYYILKIFEREDWSVYTSKNYIFESLKGVFLQKDPSCYFLPEYIRNEKFAKDCIFKFSSTELPNDSVELGDLVFEDKPLRVKISSIKKEVGD